MSNLYENPLISRYASKEMAETFSNDEKFSTWRKLWIALAESQRELGLNITEEQIEEMKEFCENINYDVAKQREKETRHDVMSHVYAFGVQCPNAKPIIHLGATSAYVGDNTDVIVIRKALMLIKNKLVNLINELSKFAFEYREIPTLGFTHFQPAQLTTVGKRATLWIMELIMDYEDLVYTIDSLRFRGVKGTTGTQASYLNLFNNDHKKVESLDKSVAKKMGFDRVFPVTGQTYSRKLDYKVLSVLSGIAQSVHKMTNDIRLLQHLKEVEEPFEKKQIGSSAMAYKRNPMRSERVASLARYVMSSLGNTAMTSSTQWFERTLDDSANRRISIPQSFLATDAILKICINISQGMVVNDKVIMKHIMEELPFMTTENIIMESVKRGGDRQELHEKIREYSMEAAKEVKQKGNKNNLLEMIANDEEFGLSKKDIDKLMDPKLYIGRSKDQVEEFIKTDVSPIIEENKGALGIKVTLEV
ncbi:adenylosuccinate lyase [Anaeromicrobium sediminis]|uniref:Adenylosuccinate lyase n=1 Tax=Anaeromicrobium sediminis TaxID=1478221 RepID=A0A267MMR6_9FIRM|nr:adenylosuccinate lyase [Anaeromicrobium sediminis]PAB60894.1 adenylosuccinate lyase [Anaeromicrobium sediminis]